MRSPVDEPNLEVLRVNPTPRVLGDLVAGEPTLGVTSALQVAVSGRLGQREWTSSDGSQHSRYEIVAEDIELLTVDETARELAL